MSAFVARHAVELAIAGLLLLTHSALIGMLIRERRALRRSAHAAQESETARKQAERDAMSRLQMLAHASRASTLGALSGSLAHELNQPLTAILSNAQVAGKLVCAEPVQCDEMREILDDIVSDTKRATEVIRRLRKLLRADDTDHGPVDVNDIVSSTIGLVGDDITVRKVNLSLDLEPGLAPIIGDAVQLQQVVLNLVVNAMDALEQVPPADRLLSVSTEKNGHWLKIRVVDTGPGAPPDVLDRMFEPFVTTKSSGMGLGLYINRSIIAAHGGEIRARPGEGRGLAMEIALPCALDAAGPAMQVRPGPRSNIPFPGPLSA